MTGPSPHVGTPTDLLNASSSASIELALLRIRTRLRRWRRWLNNSHPYLNVIGALEPPSKAIDGIKLAEYIACSIPLHLVDGWVFLARAFDAVRQGDQNTAAHLAYYAELRAAMSLLASEGIGVFRNRHVAIDSTFTSTDWNNVGTHRATWDLLTSWADDPARVSTLLTAVTVESRPISEWLVEAGISPSVQHLVARRWLESWSIDLTIFPADRDLRNHTSYRPSRLAAGSATAMDVDRDVIDPIIRTWDALEPSVDRGGAVVDNALLFLALRLAHNEDNPGGQTWDRFIDRLQGIASVSLETQLRNPSANNYYVLTWADNSSRPPPTQAVLARGTLLLRIANGICAQRLTNAQITKEDMQFWWNRFGEDGGLWSDETELDSFADLWAEVNDAIIDTQSLLASMSSPKTMSEISPIFGQGVPLTQYSRAPLWLLGVD